MSPDKELDLQNESPAPQSVPFAVDREQPFDPSRDREGTRGDLARGLLWLLTFAVGGVLAFIGLGRLEGTVLTQSIFPSLIALAGTALGFYFGSQTTGSGGQGVPLPVVASGARSVAGRGDGPDATAKDKKQLASSAGEDPGVKP